MDELPHVASPPAAPVLVFDGDCGFCRYWIARWQARSAGAVAFLPFQDPQVTGRFPEVPRARFARAVQLIDTDGSVTEGAHAIFRALDRSGRRLPLRLYLALPLFAAVTEHVYRFVAVHRSFASRVTDLVWGREVRPSTYSISSWLFLRLIGVVYLIAFLSLAVQIRGLVGQDGILPAREFMAGVREWAGTQQIGFDRFRVVPTLFWFDASDGFLEGTCAVGAALACLVAAGVAPLILLPLLWAGYLSLMVIGRVFLWYQWDSLLLEAGLLAMFMAPVAWRHRLRQPIEPPRIGLWLLSWLLFRLIFESGVVKLASGDATWRGLTALTFHYQTQPLPTPVAWYAHQLPQSFHGISTAAVLGIELAVPWLIFAPRRLRLMGCAALVALQLAIWLTGNYTFFNLLAIALCVLLVDDAAAERIVPRLRRYRLDPVGQPSASSPLRSAALVALAVITVPVATLTLMREVGVNPPGRQVIEPVAEFIAPFHSVNAYGLFAVMTTTRPELIVEGSNDGVTWRSYEFKYKPGNVGRRPPWVAPHQPRLDWQMWFAALGSNDFSWLERFCQRLLTASPTVLRLLSYDPFDGKPPRFVRIMAYDYRFSDLATRRTKRVWWTRTELGAYGPIMSASDAQRP